MTLTAILASAILMGASAEPIPATTQPVTDPMGVVPNLAFQHIDPVIRDFDNSVEYVTISGVQVMRIESRGRVVLLIPNSCSLNGCAGLRLLAGVNETASPEAINQFNATTPIARAYLNADGKVEMMHYMVGDYGVTRGSLIVNIGAFFAGMDKWTEEYSRGVLVQSVDFEPLMEGEAVAENHISREVLDLLWQDPSLHNQSASSDEVAR